MAGSEEEEEGLTEVHAWFSGDGSELRRAAGSRGVGLLRHGGARLHTWSA